MEICLLRGLASRSRRCYSVIFCIRECLRGVKLYFNEGVGIVSDVAVHLGFGDALRNGSSASSHEVAVGLCGLEDVPFEVQDCVPQCPRNCLDVIIHYTQIVAVVPEYHRCIN